MASSSPQEQLAVYSPASSSVVATEPSTPTTPKGLNIVARRGEALFRHQPYPIVGPPGGKPNANKIHAEGSYRPQACTRCLGSIGNWKDSQKVGVGASDYNELFSCLIDRRYGKDGSQCGRCIALGCGRDCCDPPPALHAEVRRLIPALREYNGVLTAPANADKAGNKLTDTERVVIQNAVDLATAFRQRLSGATASKTFIPPQTQRKKRGFKEVSELDESLTNVESQTKDLRRDIQTLSSQFGVIAGEVRALRGDVRDLHRYLRHSRERERHMVEVIDHILGRVVAIHNADGDYEAPPKAFDWDNRAFETEDEERPAEDD